MSDRDADLADVVRAFRKSLDGVTADFKDAFDRFQDEAQYRFDKELGKQLAKHPEFYAELKRTYRKVRKDIDQGARSLGLK